MPPNAYRRAKLISRQVREAPNDAGYRVNKKHKTSSLRKTDALQRRVRLWRKANSTKSKNVIIPVKTGISINKKMKKIIYSVFVSIFITSFSFASETDLDPFPTKKKPFNLDVKDNFTLSHDKRTDDDFLYNNLIFRGKWNDSLLEEMTAEVHLVDILTCRENDDFSTAADIFSDSFTDSFLVDPLKKESSVSGDLTNLFYADRAFLHYKLESTDVILGRQAVTYGKTFFWTPLDWLSPFSPFSIDREYKQGIDALNIRHYPSSLSEFGLTFAFGKDFDKETSGYVLHYRNNVREWDYVVQLGLVRDRDKIGLGLSGDPDWMNGAALRLELAASDSVFQGTLGIEYRFTNELYLLWEYHYNGFGTAEPDKYLYIINEGFFGTETFQLGQNLTGISLSYEFSPLLTGNLSFILNLDDPSGLVMPYLTYSLANEADLSLGLYLPFGKDAFPDIESEFGYQPFLFYAQLRMAF